MQLNVFCESPTQARRRLQESTAIVENHRAECDIRDRRLKAREEEIVRRNRELIRLSRKLRKQEQGFNEEYKKLQIIWHQQRQQTGKGADVAKELPCMVRESNEIARFYRPTAAPFGDGTELMNSFERQISSVDQFKSLLAHIDSMKVELLDEFRAQSDGVWSSETDVKQHRTSTPPASRPFAARHLPTRPKSAVMTRPKSAFGSRPLSARSPHSTDSAKVLTGSAKVPEAWPTQTPIPAPDFLD